MSTRTRAPAKSEPAASFRWGSVHFLVVSGQDDAVLFHARRIRESEVRLGLDTWGISTAPARPLLSLHGTSKREMREIKRIFKTAAPLSSPAYILHRIGNHGFDFLSEEGLSCLLPNIRKQNRGAVAFSASVKAGPLSAATVDAFNRIRRAALNASCQVLVFMTCTEENLLNEFLKFADELAYVDQCEPEPTAVLGLSVRWAGFRYQTDLAENRPKMISVYADSKEFYQKVDDFLTADLSTRVMARLRDGGRSLAVIADVFHVNKSTVKRRLDAVRRGSFADEDESWLVDYEQYLDIDSGQLWPET